MFRKRKADGYVIFVDASPGYEKGTDQNRLGLGHLTKFIAVATEEVTVDKYA